MANGPAGILVKVFLYPLSLSGLVTCLSVLMFHGQGFIMVHLS